jgi:protoheme IX farnesyltransferase
LTPPSSSTTSPGLEPQFPGLASGAASEATERVLSGWRLYYRLTKPTVTMLVVVTVIPALFLAAGGVPSPAAALAALVGTMLASASAATWNQLIETDRDGAMTRTRRRPMPSGQIEPLAAATFATGLGLGSFLVLYAFATPLAAWIALAANFGYVVGYTMFLKPRTVQNIVIGGAAGCVGPLIGWAAVTGTLGWEAWALFAIIFLWTPPHFWALALKYKDDYARASFPMMPVVRGEAATKRQMLLYTLTLVPPVVALWAYGAAGLWYLIPSLLATLGFIWRAYKLWREPGTRLAMPLFFYSCGYLFLVFGALTADRLIAAF